MSWTDYSGVSIVPESPPTPTLARVYQIIITYGQWSNTGELIAEPTIEVTMKGCDAYLDEYGDQVDVDGLLYWQDYPYNSSFEYDPTSDTDTQKAIEDLKAAVYSIYDPDLKEYFTPQPSYPELP